MTDTERMDWMERTGHRPKFRGKNWLGHPWILETPYADYYGDTIRECIDNAIQGEK